MLQREHSAILLTFIKLPIVIKIFVLSIFEWSFYIVLLYSMEASFNKKMLMNTTTNVFTEKLETSITFGLRKISIIRCILWFLSAFEIYCQNVYLMYVYKRNKNEIIVFLMYIESRDGYCQKNPIAIYHNTGLAYRDSYHDTYHKI